MANLNKVMIIGNLTRNPELKHTPKGTAVAELGVAINRTWTNDAGTKQEDTTFVDVTFWGRSAEVIAQYMTKGSPIYIEGRLQLDSWDDKETGKKRSKLRVVGEAFQFLASGKDREESKPPAPRPQQRSLPPAPKPPAGEYDGDDDIPF